MSCHRCCPNCSGKPPVQTDDPPNWLIAVMFGGGVILAILGAIFDF